MKFDIVIGNPPYNKGMDLDFVHKGYQLSSNYTVMITPAKWQTCPDDYSGCASKTIDYKQFRELYVKHMFKVCFYPDCVDVFNVSQSDGISWYAMDKKTHDKCEVINICNTNSKLNSVAIRSLRERERVYITSVQRLCIA